MVDEREMEKKRLERRAAVVSRPARRTMRSEHGI